MVENTPLVTIGLPVFNGERYLAAAIESVLAQTFRHLELVISDNGSDDDTESICRKYAAQDDRIHYHRSPENRGASWNYNRVVELARGKYFRWLAHDDMLEPSTLEESVTVLESRPDVVLCFTATQDIDDQGNFLSVKHSGVDAQATEAYKRFAGLSRVHPSHNCEEVFGLMRLDILRKTKMIDNYTDSDRTLLATLGLYGPFYEIQKPLFLHRIHPASSVQVNPNAAVRAAWFDPKLRDRIVFPKWRQMYELFVAIARSPLPSNEKAKCYFQMLHWIKNRRKNLRREVSGAANQLFRGSRISANGTS